MAYMIYTFMAILFVISIDIFFLILPYLNNNSSKKLIITFAITGATSIISMVYLIIC
jgi:hypothetical protein